MARRSVSRIEGQCTNQEVYQAQRPRCGSFALSNSAVWIIRTIHLTMAQVIESEIREREVPYPLLGGRNTSGSFRSLLWRRVGFQGVTDIVMEGSPAPTHFSRVSEAGSSPGQCQPVLFSCIAIFLCVKNQRFRRKSGAKNGPGIRIFFEAC